MKGMKFEAKEEGPHKISVKRAQNVSHKPWI